MSGQFPWGDFMFAGMGILRLPPREFWAASPREIASAFPRVRRETPERADFESLMQRFPDGT